MQVVDLDRVRGVIEQGFDRLLDQLEELREPNVVDLAWEIAQQAHDGQTDKCGRPYMEHVTWVWECFKPFGEESLREQCAALLHDVVEDSEITLEYLRESGIPERVVQAVDALTRREGESRPEYLRRCAADPIALKVKLADVAHNMQPTRLNALSAEESTRLHRKYVNTINLLAQWARA